MANVVVTVGGLVFHRDLARDLYRKYLEAYQARSGVYSIYHHSNRVSTVWHRFLPEDIEWGSLDHRLFLFGANLLDYQTTAETAFRVASKLWSEKKVIFFEAVTDFGSEQRHHVGDLFPGELALGGYSKTQILYQILKKARYTSPGQAASRWFHSFSMLWSRFGGDPLNIFKEYQSVEDYLDAKKSLGTKAGGGIDLLPGIGSKLFSLLAFHMEELGLIGYVRGSLPVDVHLQSQHLSCRAVTGSGLAAASDLERLIRPAAVAVCEEIRVSPTWLAAAMWFNGSVNCVNCNKGRSDGLQRKIAQDCPVYDSCSGRVSDVALYRTSGRWNLDRVGQQTPLLDPGFFLLEAPQAGKVPPLSNALSRRFKGKIPIKKV